MLDIARYTGIRQFGRAYEVMLKNDPHAAGSVVHVLMDRMVRLCEETSDYLYNQYTPSVVAYQYGSRERLEASVSRITVNRRSNEERIEAIMDFCVGLGERAPDDINDLRFGGTEEEIIDRGSDWCTDVARVACILYQVAGFPCRTVSLFDIEEAYSGHNVVEVYRDGKWGVVDAVFGVIYRNGDGVPAPALELENNPDLIAYNWADRTDGSDKAGLFRGVAISNYLVSDHGSYDYTVSGLNDYTRAILEESSRGWPGGLRWLFAEDVS